MKRIVQLLTMVSFAVPAISHAADGDAFKQNRKFPAGVYEATVDAKVYFDVTRDSVEQGVVIKKGTRINVYSAGNAKGAKTSFEWFSLGDTQNCNADLLPWDRFTWAGVQKKDFYRVGNLPKPVYKNGLVTNCDSGNGASATSGSNALLTIRESSRPSRSEKNVTSRQAIEVTGKIEQDSNAAGGSYAINGGRGKQYTLGYIRDLDEETQNKMNRLVKSGVSVTVKGVLKTWADGSTSFDNDQPVTVNFVTVRSSSQYSTRKGGNGKSIEVTGRVDFGTNAAGGNFFIDAGRGRTYILGYYRDLDDETQSQLGRLADSGTTVTARGVTRSWDDGTSSFDNSQPINLYFVIKRENSGRSSSYEGASAQRGSDRDVVVKVKSVTGRVEFGSNAAGGNYWINDGRGKQFTLGYVRDLDQDTQSQLSRLADSGDRVTVKGTLRTWKDGTASFDNTQPISIYKMR